MQTLSLTDRENEIFTATGKTWSILSTEQRHAWAMSEAHAADCLKAIGHLGFWMFPSSHKGCMVITDGTYFIA